MHARDEFVSYGHFDAEIAKLNNFLAALGIDVNPDSDLGQQTYAAFHALYFSVFANERPAMSTWDQAKAGGALAGLGDLAAKINRAAASGPRDALKPHLKKMVTGAVRMNDVSSVTDEAANKNSELYVGCLALGAGMSVDLEDPEASAGGKNPDVLLTFEDAQWAIAVKASHSAKAATIFGNIEKAVSQIERSGRNGIVFINIKNVLAHEAMNAGGHFASPSEAATAVGNAVDAIVRDVRASIVNEDWLQLFTGKLARPLVVFMGQITVSAVIPAIGPAFVPVKIMRILPAPPAPEDASSLAGLDAKAWKLATTLNEELQRNSS